MVYDDLFLWLGLSLLQALAIITIVLAPPVAAGLNLVANRVANGKRVNFQFFVEGFREYFWRSYLIGGVWAVVMALVVFNIYFYAQNIQGALRYLIILWFYLALMWLAILPYLFPIMISSKTPTVRNVYKNVILLSASQPLYTLALFIQFVLLLLLVRVVPVLLVAGWPAVVALIGNLGAVYLITSVVGENTDDME